MGLGVLKIELDPELRERVARAALGTGVLPPEIEGLEDVLEGELCCIAEVALELFIKSATAMKTAGPGALFLEFIAACRTEAQGGEMEAPGESVGE